MSLAAAIGHMEEGLRLTCHSSFLPSHSTHSLFNLSVTLDMPLLHMPLPKPNMTATGYFEYSPIPTSLKNIN